MAEVVGYLDMHIIGALATTLGHRVKGVYNIRCRSCGADLVNKLGPHRRFRYWRLKGNDYRPTCTRRFLQSLQLRLVEVHDALHELGLG